MDNHKPSIQCGGFTLIEVAIVMIIVGLLISAFIAPLSVQLDSRNYNETRNALAEAKEALVGFALSHAATDEDPYLPCPDNSGDGLEDRKATGECQVLEGNLPTQTLGLVSIDSWNNQYLYHVAPQFSNSVDGFNLSALGNITVRNAAGANLVDNIPALVLSRGKNGAAAAVSPDEQENTDADTIFISHEFTPAFDDIVVWISPNILLNRMVTANRLP